MTTKDVHDHDVLSSNLECCMCGDYGLSQELFRCRICLSRFQHRYCSNLYPKPGTYRVCNWCLDKQGNGTRIARSQSNAAEGDMENRKRAKKNGISNHDAIKKEKVHSDQSISIGRRKISEETLRRTKSEEIVNTGMLKNHPCRARVRRYKLLEEVSTK